MEDARKRIRLGERDRIVERVCDLQVPQVRPAISFRQVQGFAVRLARAIQPAPVIETDGVDDERIALPVPDRVAVPSGRLNLQVMWAAIQEKTPVTVRVALRKQHDQLGSLNDLIGAIRYSHGSIRQAVLLRIVLSFISLAFFVKLLGFRLVGRIARKLRAPRENPNTGQVHFSVESFRGRTLHLATCKDAHREAGDHVKAAAHFFLSTSPARCPGSWLFSLQTYSVMSNPVSSVASLC